MLSDTFKTAGHAELLKWAAKYLGDWVETLERAHADEWGRIRPPETRAEIKLLRAWLDRAAQLDTNGAGGRLSAILSPGATLEDALTKSYPANQA